MSFSTDPEMGTLVTRLFSKQDLLPNLWSPVQDENAGPLAQKLRILRQ